MCGRYVSARSTAEWAALLGAENRASAVEPSYNVAPTQQVPVVVQRDGRRELTGMRWGLVPSWARAPTIGSRLINARLETVAEKPAFRSALRRRRALLPADGFYEWADTDAGRQATYLHPPDGGALVFAGLWEVWHPPDGGAPWHTVTILTTSAPDGLGVIHPRAPVVVDRGLWERWLDPAAVAPLDELDAALAEHLEIYPVDAAVGNVRSHGAHLIEAQYR